MKRILSVALAFAGVAFSQTVNGIPNQVLSAVNAATGLTGVASGTNGGTGVNNGSNTITLGGNLALTGAFNLTLAVPATGTWTLPAAGTLIGSADTGTIVAGMLATASVNTAAIGGGQVTNAKLANSSLTVNGTAISLGASATVFPVYNAVTFSATPVFAMASNSVFKITLTGNVTSSTFTSPNAGQTVTFIICQDATGGRTFVWPSSNFFGAMTIGSTASKCSSQQFTSDGTNLYAANIGVINQ